MSEKKLVSPYCGYGTGRRKSSTARVFMRKGSGKIIVNDKDVVNYFSRKTDVMLINEPLELLALLDAFDFKINVGGGGSTGQAGAVRLGLCRALVAYDPELKSSLRKAGFMTRDAREVERKKVGLRKARRRPQYSKR